MPQCNSPLKRTISVYMQGFYLFSLEPDFTDHLNPAFISSRRVKGKNIQSCIYPVHGTALFSHMLPPGMFHSVKACLEACKHSCVSEALLASQDYHDTTCI